MSELVMIETNSASGTVVQTPDDYLAWARPLVAERGTDAASVACDESGRLLTPPGYADACLDVSPTARLIACRRVTGNAFLALDNVDYVTEHWSLAIYDQPHRFGALENGSTHWLYTGEWSDETYPSTQATTPVWDAAMARYSSDGECFVFVEHLAQEQVHVWREDLATGARTALAALPRAVLVGDIAFVGDGTLAIIGGGEAMYLVNVVTGDVAKLPERFRAACWDPFGGPSSLLAAVHNGRTSVIGTYSLHTGEWKPVSEVPAQVLDLDVSSDGQIAAVVSAEATFHTPNVAVIDPGRGSYTLARPLTFDSGATRRTHRPRWISRPSPAAEPTRLADGWVAAFRQNRPARTVDYNQRLLTEWLERISRRVEAVDADPARIRLLSQLRALCFEATQLSPTFSDAARQVVVPRLREIAGRPIPGDLREIYERCADDLSA